MTVNIEPMSRDFVALELLKHKDIAPAAAFKMADEFILLSDYKEVYRAANGNILPCDRCGGLIEKGQHRHEGQRIYHQTC